MDTFKYLGTNKEFQFNYNQWKGHLAEWIVCYEYNSITNKGNGVLTFDNITIKQKERFRTIKNIELEFDFTEMNISKSFILIHLLYRETDNEHTFSIPASDNELPPYLQKFLPLFVVRFPPHNPKPTINLLQQYQLHQLMRKRHF